MSSSSDESEEMGLEAISFRRSIELGASPFPKKEAIREAWSTLLVTTGAFMFCG